MPYKDPERARIRAREYYYEHIDEIRAKSKEYSGTHKEILSNRHRQWAIKNPDKVRAAARRYRLAHPDRKKAQFLKWKNANPEKLRSSNDKWHALHPEIHQTCYRKHRAIKKNALGNGISTKEASQLLEEYHYQCAYCGNSERLEIDHIVPLSNSGLHDISNATIACRSCNAKKNDKSLLRWMYESISKEAN